MRTQFDQLRNGKSKAEVSDEVTPETTPFPYSLGSEAFQGVAGEIVRLLEPHTEADPVGLLVTLIVMFGNVIGRSPCAIIEGARHGVNEFALIVGESASARKGTSLSHIRRLFESADPLWTNSRIVNGLSSGQGIIHAIRDAEEGGAADADRGIADKRLMVVESEFTNVLRLASGRENTLSPTLRCAWDAGTLQNLTRQRSERCTRPHVSILGHITVDELRRDATDRELANGFLNRFLIVAVRRSKILPFGGKVPPGDLERAIHKIEFSIRFAREVGQVDLSEDAKLFWVDLYRELTELPPGPLGAQLSRGAPHVRRLAMIFALLDKREEVGVDHLAAAAMLWDYSRRSVEYIFAPGESEAAKNALAILNTFGQVGMTRRELHRELGGHVRSVELTNLLQSLEAGGLARREKIPPPSSGGRPGERWFITERGQQ